MATLKDVRAGVAALISDPDQDILTNAYFLPFCNQVYEQQVSFLSGTCNPFETKLVTLPKLGVGTCDLTGQQKDNGPLVGLINPLELRWKPAGMPENNYSLLRRFNVLPNAAWPFPAISTVNSYQAGWEWRGNAVFLTPFSILIDLQVRGEFKPPRLLKDDDEVQVHHLLGNALVYGTAALIAVERGNPEWTQSYGQLAQNTLNEISNQMMRQMQSVTYRAGRMNRRRR